MRVFPYLGRALDWMWEIFLEKGIKRPFAF